MPQFMLAAYSSAEPREPMTPEDMQRGFGLVQAVEADMRAANALVYSGRLLEPSSAKVVRPGRRMSSTTDGPYAETKEHIGGFYIVAAPDLDAALEWASKVSDAISSPIEVWPFMEVPER
jgi:hypothetical protein